MGRTDTSESGLEALVVEPLVSEAGYVQGRSEDFDRDHAVDLAQLRAFIAATQPKAAEALGLGEESPRRTQFLHRLQGEITKRGVIDVLRRGVQDGPVKLDLFYGTPTPGNTEELPEAVAEDITGETVDG